MEHHAPDPNNSDTSDPTDAPSRSDHEEARQHLRDLLALCGIERVVSVDDGNRQTEEPEIDRELIAKALASGTLSMETLLSSENTRQAVVNDDDDPRDIEDILDDVRVDPPSYEDSELKELTNAARLAEKSAQQSDLESDTTADGDQTLPDTTTLAVDIETLSALENLFEGSAEFKPLTLAQWQESKADLLANNSPVLILFDRDFRLEGEGAETGDQLITDVIHAGSRSVFCGMLTHSATSDDAELRTSREIAGNLGVDPAELIVMAKEQVRHAPIGLVRKIKAALLARELVTLRTMTSEALVEATRDGIAELSSLDAYTLLAMVDAAGKEGVHDAHNLVRVAASHSRRSLVTRLHHEDVMKGPLSNLRKTRDASPPGYFLQKPTDLDRRRHLDSFDDAEHLSSLNLPIEPGDIFQAVDPSALLSGKVTAHTRRYILLTQPCDTVIRPDGTRMANPTMLSVAPLKWIAAEQTQVRGRASDFQLRWFEPDDSAGDWYARLAERTQIPAIGIDACALSTNGAGVIEVGSSPPSSLTPGWLLRYEKLQEWAQSRLRQLAELESRNDLPSELRRLIVAYLTGTAKDLHEVKADMDSERKIVTFGIRRIARLTDPRTRSLLTLASHHLGRPADEGQLLEELPPDPEGLG